MIQRIEGARPHQQHRSVSRRHFLGRGLAVTAGTAAAVVTPGLLPYARTAVPVSQPDWPAALSLPAAVDDVNTAVAPVGRALQMPFTLGVASGDPTSDGVVLWTRLAPEPLDADGRGGMPARDVEVEWQLAGDAGFRSVLRTGTETARRSSAHSVHVELSGLPADGEFFYRFRADGHLSPVGRTRTAPAPGSLAPLTFAVTSCSNFEHGWFTAYRHLADSGPDLVFNLGDYLYEAAPGAFPVLSGSVRYHVGERTTTLHGYRQRHAQYKADPDLQAAHAAAPWVVAYDDHEVLNNWAANTAAHTEDQRHFPAIRTAAMQAYYEHMPLRRVARPHAGHMQMYRRLSWGQLANFHVLDTRQYRDNQPCGDGIDKRCPERHDPRRTMLGRRQEAWLAGGLAASEAKWDVLAQQIFFSPLWLRGFPWGADNPGKTGFNMDAWDGYPDARERLLKSVAAARLRNFAILTGDWHSHWAANVLNPYADLDSTPLGIELVTSSISSDGDGERHPAWGLRSMALQPYLRHFDQRRGWIEVNLTAQRLRADFRVVDYVSRKGAPARSSGVFVAQDGLPGLLPA